MRVCFFCPHVLPLFGIATEETFGGAEVKISILSRYLVRLGFDVDIVVSSSAGNACVVDGIRLIPSVDDTARAGFARKLSCKLKLLRSLKRSAADVYLATCAAPEVGVMALFTRFVRRPFIYYTAHDMDCDGSYERQNGWRGRLFGFGLRSADTVVTQHEGHQQLLAQRGIDAEVIYNSFELPSVAPASEREIDVLWVARCQSWKRPELFLDLVMALPKRSFAMIAPPIKGEEALFERIRAAAAKLPNLTFIESVPFTESQTYYERSRLFVGTSDFEGFPNTYIQACIAGTPIASLSVDPEGFIAREGAGIVANGDPGRLRGALEQLLDNRAEWARCSKRASAYARERHNIEVEGAKWARLLRSLVPNARQARA